MRSQRKIHQKIKTSTKEILTKTPECGSDIEKEEATIYYRMKCRQKCRRLFLMIIGQIKEFTEEYHIRWDDFHLFSQLGSDDEVRLWHICQT